VSDVGGNLTILLSAAENHRESRTGNADHIVLVIAVGALGLAGSRGRII
jgi:hypothetical protein